MSNAPQTPDELDDLITALLTDPLFHQNTAAKLRLLLHTLNASAVNRLLDGASGGNPPDYAALLQALKGKQDKVQSRLISHYSANLPSQDLLNLETILDYLFLNAGAATLTRATDLDTLEQERAAQPPVPLLPGGEYAISGNWNKAGDQVVYVHAADATRFRVEGTLLNQGVATAVTVDVVAGTAVALGGGGPLNTFDLLGFTISQLDEVMALSYVNCDADPAASPAWSKPGMEFEAIDPADGGNYLYRCRRQTYIRGNPATGVGPAWHRTAKV